MHLKLGGPYEKFIHGQIKTGLYSNASGFVRDALHHMQEDNEKRRIEHIPCTYCCGRKADPRRQNSAL